MKGVWDGFRQMFPGDATMDALIDELDLMSYELCYLGILMTMDANVTAAHDLAKLTKSPEQYLAACVAIRNAVLTKQGNPVEQAFAALKGTSVRPVQ